MKRRFNPVKRNILIIAAILVVAIIIIRLILSNKEQVVLGKIPKEAKSLAVIDLQGLSAKLFLDELGSDEKSTTKLVKLFPELSNLDWSKSGISLMSPATLFTLHDEKSEHPGLYSVLEIADYSQFTSFLDSLVIATNAVASFNKKDNYLRIEKHHLTAVWDKNFLVLSFNSTDSVINQAAIFDILNTENEESILSDSIFTTKLDADYDLFVFARPQMIKLGNKALFIGDDIIAITSYLNFYDGELVLKTEVELKDESPSNRLFAKTKKEIELIEKVDSCALFAVLNVNAEYFLKLVRNNFSLKLNKNQIPLLSAWNGSANITLNGLEVVTKEYISYEYDDDFNKVEVISKDEKKVLDIRMNLGVNGQNDVFKKGKDTLLYKGSDIAIHHIGTTYLCHNINLPKPVLQKQVSNDALFIDVQYSKLKNLLKYYNINHEGIEWIDKFGVDKAEIRLNKNQKISINCKIGFLNKDKNSLFSIADGMMNLD